MNTETNLAYIILLKSIADNPDISLEGKVLFSILLDRRNLSLENNWVDENGEVFMYLSNEEAQKKLSCKKNKVTKTFKELENLKLIKRKKQRMCKPDIIYILNDFGFNLQTYGGLKKKSGKSENKDTEGLKKKIGSIEKEDCEGLKNKNTESSKTSPNNNNINNNKINNNSANNNHQIKSADDDFDDETNSYKKIIFENINYSLLAEKYGCSNVDKIFDVICEVVENPGNTYRINKRDYYGDIVKSIFLKLNYSHIEEVIESYINVCDNINNTKSYLISMLYNSYISGEKPTYNPSNKRKRKSNFSYGDGEYSDLDIMAVHNLNGISG